MGSKIIEICCGSCESKWRVPAMADSNYTRESLESKPCPNCGLHTMSVIVPEPVKRSKFAPSFVFPRLGVNFAS